MIYNRLAQGMTLDIDATVYFALGRRAVTSPSPTSTVDSPYNTRGGGSAAHADRHAGRASLEAALNPQPGRGSSTCSPTRRATTPSPRATTTSSGTGTRRERRVCSRCRSAPARGSSTGAALQAVRDAFPPREHLLNDQREGQRGDREIHAGHAQRGEAHEHAGGGGGHHGQRHPDDPGQPEILGEVHVRVRADAEEGRRGPG